MSDSSESRVMRSRETIMKKANDPCKEYRNTETLILEVLLDVRDLLMRMQP